MHRWRLVCSPLAFISAPAVMLSSLVPPFPNEVLAIDYLTVEQAQRLAFPEATAFISSPLKLSASQRDAINRDSGVDVTGDTLQLWKVQRGDLVLGYFVVDSVIGKHLLIDYSVAISPTGIVNRVEILTYRENYGGAVSNREWLKSFEHKRFSESFKVGEDIPHISGATLSSVHIAEGVRRVLITLKLAADIPSEQYPTSTPSNLIK